MQSLHGKYRSSKAVDAEKDAVAIQVMCEIASRPRPIR